MPEGLSTREGDPDGVTTPSLAQAQTWVGIWEVNLLIKTCSSLSLFLILKCFVFFFNVQIRYVYFFKGDDLEPQTVGNNCCGSWLGS